MTVGRVCHVSENHVNDLLEEEYSIALIEEETQDQDIVFFLDIKASH